MKKYNEYINESVLGAMKPKSEEQVTKAIFDLFGDNPTPDNFLSLIFEKDVDIRVLPKQNNLFNEFGEELYNYLYIIYDLISELKHIGLSDVAYIDTSIIEYNINIGDYDYRLTFDFGSIELCVNANVEYNGGDMSFYLDFSEINDKFNDKFKKSLMAISEDDRNNIKLADKAIMKLTK